MAVAGFGQLLRGSNYLGDWAYSEAIELAQSARGADPFGYRAEAITLMGVDEPLAPATLDEIRALPQVHEARALAF